MLEIFDPRQLLEALQNRGYCRLPARCRFAKALDDLPGYRCLGKNGKNDPELAKSLGQLSIRATVQKAGQAINEAQKGGSKPNFQPARSELPDLSTRREALPPSGSMSPFRPGQRKRATLHPVSQVTDEVTAIFADMGFAVAEGPDIDDDFHNFTALEFPARTSGPGDARHLLP